MIDDDPNEPIEIYFDVCFDFLDHCAKPVLVHCEAGMSRSATMVIAWLMHRGQTLSEAYNYVIGKRSFIQPNNGFLFKLYQLSEKLYPNDKDTILFIFNHFGVRGEERVEDLEMATKFVNRFAECKFDWSLFWKNFSSFKI